MVKIFGREYSKNDLLEKVGDISQIGGVRLNTLTDGPENGVRAAEFRTGSGLNFRVLLDRSLDISTAEYKGQPLAWRSAAGDKSPAYFNEVGLGWLRNFYGGLMVTCGLTYAGAPCTDQGEELGLHGRVSNTPASNVCADAGWENGSYRMWVQGKVREARLFGEKIELKRTISAWLGESKIRINDSVTNLGFQETEHMMLYHINIGFPVLDEGSRIVAPVLSSRPRDAEAEIGWEQHMEFSAPVEGFSEKVYYLDMVPDKNGIVSAALVNEGFDNGSGFGVYIRYSKNQLPRFIEWKHMGQGDYVVGMEPANCLVEGRDKDRERGTLQFLKPGETREYEVEIGVLPSNKEISEFEKGLEFSVES